MAVAKALSTDNYYEMLPTAGLQSDESVLLLIRLVIYLFLYLNRHRCNGNPIQFKGKSPPDLLNIGSPANALQITYGQSAFADFPREMRILFWAENSIRTSSNLNGYFDDVGWRNFS